MSEDLDSKLPKQELLLKILKMTTSDNDGTALVAIRRANEFLSKHGWDWDKLINAKIMIAADPFANLQTPQAETRRHTAAPTPPPRPAAPQPPPPPRPQAPPKPRAPLGNRDNMYAGWCYCCGDPVAVKAGWMFDPSAHNRNARSKLVVACDACNKSAYPSIGASAATRRKTHANVSGAANLGNI